MRKTLAATQILKGYRKVGHKEPIPFCYLNLSILTNTGKFIAV